MKRSIPGRSWVYLFALLCPAAALTAVALWRGSPSSNSDTVEGPPYQAPARKKGKSHHPPITAVRDRMLEHYHGTASAVFISTPGFGSFRMGTTRQKIPYQIPFLSADKLDVEKPIQEPSPLLGDVVARSQAGFLKRPIKGVRTLVPAEDPLKEEPLVEAHFENLFGKSDGDGEVFMKLQLRSFDLIGLLDRDNPTAYSSGPVFELVPVSGGFNGPSNGGFGGGGFNTPEASGARWPSGNGGRRQDLRGDRKPETRGLDLFELAGVKELYGGKQVYIRTQDNVVRMLGALRATRECLECHAEFREGDLLGAFSYTIVDTERPGKQPSSVLTGK